MAKKEDSEPGFLDDEEEVMSEEEEERVRKELKDLGYL